MLDFSVKINPSLEEIAIKAIKDTLKKIDPNAVFLGDFDISQSDEKTLKSRIKEYQDGKMEFSSLDEINNSLDNVIAKYE